MTLPQAEMIFPAIEMSRATTAFGDSSCSSPPPPHHTQEGLCEAKGSQQEAKSFERATDSAITLEAQPVTLSPEHSGVDKHGRLIPLKQFLMVYACLAISFFISSLDQTIVACLTPVIVSEFGAASAISWVGTSFLLTSTAFAPLYGRLSSVFGRKQAMLAAQVIFAGGNAVCGFAPDITVLIVGRAIAGVGGAGILSMVQICVSDIVALRHRGKYHGILGSFNGAGTTVGPLVGAIIGSKLGWRWAFYLQLPIAGAVLIITFLFLPSVGVADRSKFKEKLRSIDYAGMITLVAGCTLFLLALNLLNPPQVPFVSGQVLGFLLAGIVLLVMFTVVEWKWAKAPIMPLPVFSNSAVDLGLILTGLFGWVFYASIYYIPLYFQVVDAQGLLQSSVSLLPLVVASIAFSTFTGLATSWTGNYKVSIITAFTLMTLGSGLWAFATNKFTGVGILTAYNLILGVGFGCVMQNSLVAVQSATAQRDVAMVTAVRNFFRQMGGILGLAMSNLILTQYIQKYFVNPVSHMHLLPEDTIIRLRDSPLLVYSLPVDESIQDYVQDTHVRAIKLIFILFLLLSSISLIIAVVLPEFSLDRSPEGEPQRKPRANSTWGSLGRGLSSIRRRILKKRTTPDLSLDPASNAQRL